jgi:GNAT superfamily N-acetyltransferase
MGADPAVLVRRAEADDGGAVFPLAVELASSFQPSATTFRESYSQLITDPGALVLVADESGDVIGYLLGFRHRTFFADGPVGWIEEVITRSDRRRSGVAGALVRAFEEWAWDGGARMVALATRRAEAFYEALGYEESATYLRKLRHGLTETQTTFKFL